MFQLTKDEAKTMVSQNVIPSIKHLGGYLPYAFTEQGVAMLSSVLHSDRAIDVNIKIMRVFVRIKEILTEHKDLREKINALERAYKNDVAKIFFLINWLLEEKKSKKPIGFLAKYQK